MSAIWNVSPPDEDIKKNYALLVVSVFTFSLAAATTGLRMGTRALLVRSMGLDDYVILAAIIIGAISFAFSICWLAAGGARPGPVYYADKDHWVAALKYSYIGQIPYVITVCLTKISVCLMVLGVKSTKKMRWAMHLLILGLIIVNIADSVALLAQCRPIELLFDDSRKGSCWPSSILVGFTLAQGIFSVLTDFICSMLPIVVIWNIEIKLGRKIAVSGLICLGLVGTACCTIRLQAATSIHYFPSTDSLETWWPVELWAILEQNIGIMAANMATLLPLFTRLHVTSRNAFSRMQDLAPSILHRVSGGYAPLLELLKGPVSHPRMKSSIVPVLPVQSLPAMSSAEHFVFERDNRDVQRTDDRLRWLRDNGYRPVGI